MHAARPRWVIAELDVNGEIDDHAAMCLEYAIAGARELAPATIVVDLRELAAIDDAGLGLFGTHDAACRADGIQLTLLVCAGARQQAIVRAFMIAGLGDRLRYAEAPPPPTAPGPAAPAVRVSARPAPAGR